MIKVLSSAALLAAALTPVSISAQNERSSPVPRYHLVQLAVGADDISVADFQAKTQTIESCSDATKLAKEVGAKIKRNRFIRASALPKDLQKTLKDMSAGEATEVTTDGEKLRVIVLCNQA